MGPAVDAAGIRTFEKWLKSSTRKATLNKYRFDLYDIVPAQAGTDFVKWNLTYA
jgi:hypothetical protein